MHKRLMLCLAGLLLVVAACTPPEPRVATVTPGTAYPAGSRPTAAPSNPAGSYPCPGCRPTIATAPLKKDIVVHVSDMDLHGTLYTPSFSPAPAVLLLHQNGGTRADFGNLPQDMQNAGLAVLALDLRGHGQSGGQPDWNKAQDDVLRVLAWLAQQQEINGDRMAVVGLSIGANIALAATAREAPVHALVLVSPGVDYNGVQTEPAARGYRAPLMIVYSSGDTQVGDAPQRITAAYKGEKPANVVALPGEAHGAAILRNQPDLGKQIMDWLKAALSS